MAASGADRDQDRIRVLAALVQQRADLQLQDTRGATALHRAAGVGAARICMWLLHARADPNVTNFRGQTPLTVAWHNSEVGQAVVFVVNV